MNMCHIIDNILSECSYLSQFMYLWVLYINNISSSIEKEHAKLFTVLENKVFKSSFPVCCLEKENTTVTYQPCLIPGRNCFESQQVYVILTLIQV